MAYGSLKGTRKAGIFEAELLIFLVDEAEQETQQVMADIMSEMRGVKWSQHAAGIVIGLSVPGSYFLQITSATNQALYCM
jgi:acid phosphatase family membrane protein YuiD